LNVSLNQALDDLLVQLPRYFVTLQAVKDNAAQPISDLSVFTQNNALSASQFISAFNAQVRTNFANLQNLEDVCTQFLPNLNSVVSIIADSNELHLKLSWDVKKLEKVQNYIIQIRDNLVDFLGHLDSHCKFVSSTQANVPLDYFRHVRVLSYLATHKERIQVFESSANIVFPMHTPNIYNLTEEVLVIRNIDDFRRAKAAYDQLDEIATSIKKAIPTEFPVSVVNLSTFNGEPKLGVSSEEDFLIILSSYAEYHRQLENVRKCFTFELKSMVNVIVKTGYTEPNIVNNIPWPE